MIAQGAAKAAHTGLPGPVDQERKGTCCVAWVSWHMPTPGDAALLAVMGVLGVVTQACYIRGMALGEASLMAPIDYVRILFTTAIGYALFGEWPLPGTYMGLLVVIGTAIYVTLHGRRQRPPDQPRSTSGPKSGAAPAVHGRCRK